MNYSHQAVCRNELSICEEMLIYTVSIEDFLIWVISLYFLSTGSDAYIDESFSALGWCFVNRFFQKLFSSFTNKSFIIHFLCNIILDQFEKVFNFFGIIPMYKPMWKIHNVSFIMLNGVNWILTCKCQIMFNSKL